METGQFGGSNGYAVRTLPCDGLAARWLGRRHPLQLLQVDSSSLRGVVLSLDGDTILYTAPLSDEPDSFAYGIGDGRGRYAEALVTVEVIHPPVGPALMNDDPHPDLIITLETGGSRGCGATAVAFSRNPRAGLAPGGPYHLPGAFGGSVVVDMNGDGRPDLVAADDQGDAVNILLHR